MRHDSQGQIYLLVAQSEHGSLPTQHRRKCNWTLVGHRNRAGNPPCALRPQQLLDDCALVLIGSRDLRFGARGHRTGNKGVVVSALHPHLWPHQPGDQWRIALVRGLAVAAHRFADIQHRRLQSRGSCGFNHGLGNPRLTGDELRRFYWPFTVQEAALKLWPWRSSK